MIGITGGIASGKSKVAARLRHLGAVVLDADHLSREIVEPYTPGWEKVRDNFPEVIQEDSSINRRMLGQIVFADAHQRKILEGIIHPEVLLRLQAGAKAAKSAGKIVFAEVPLLYEVGWDRFMEEVWVVYVGPDVQLERLMQRSGIPRQAALEMIASQLPLEEKMKRANVVIDNNSTLAETWQQVDALWKEI
jgi:dephospho-CoA kinase